MAAPTVVHIESTQATASTTLPSSSGMSRAAVGDLCVISSTGVQSGASPSNPTLPVYTSGGADAGFTAYNSGTPLNSGAGDGRTMFYWKVLTSADFSSGNLKQFTVSTTGWSTTGSNFRSQIWVFHHAFGWDTNSQFSVYSDIAGFTANVDQTLNGGGAPSRPNVSLFLFSHNTNQNSLTIQWDASGTSRDPYVDETGATAPRGGHTTSTYNNCGVANGTSTITTSQALTSDIGRTIGSPSTLATTITGATAGVSLSIAPATYTGAGSTENVAINQPHYGSSSGIHQADYNEYDTGAGATKFQLNTGVGSAHAILIPTFQTQTATTNGTATLSGGGTFTGTGTVTVPGTGTFSGGPASAWHAAGTPTVIGTTLLTGGGTFTAGQAGVETITGTATLVGGGTLHAAGTPTVLGTATLATTATFSSSATRSVVGTTHLTGGGTFSAAQLAIIITYSAGGTWSSGSALRVGGKTWTGTATLSAGGTFAAAGQQIGPHGGVAAFQTVAALSATGARVTFGTARLGIDFLMAGEALNLGKSDRITLSRTSTLSFGRTGTLTLKG